MMTGVLLLPFSSSAMVVTPARPLLALPFDEIVAPLGGLGRARQVWDILRSGGDPFTAEDLGKKARTALESAFTPPGYTHLRSTTSSCGTLKLLIELDKGEAVETVIIPTAESHKSEGFSTLCVSSQVGCRQACTFCATGTMGLLRSLGPDEILAQVHAAMAAASSAGMPAIRNVVFMGMGEPADNLPAVEVALGSMVHPFGFALPKKHVCVSTVGPNPAAIRALEPLPCRLAWSVHAADDQLRRLLVPTTRHSMAELRDAWSETLTARNDRGLMAELTLIDGVNDGLEEADKLYELLAPLPGKTRVNLIPYNANAGLSAAGRLFQPSKPDAVRAFQRRLVEEHDMICYVRTARGDDEASACGQLRLENDMRSRSSPAYEQGTVPDGIAPMKPLEG